MRIAAPHYLLFSRYESLWRELINTLKLEWHEASLEDCLSLLERPSVQKSLEPITGVNFQLFALELHALRQDSDALLVPALNNIEVHASKGSGQNPWIASLADMLQSQFRQLPRVLSVPARHFLEREVLEPIVIRTLMELLANAALVRRSWERQRLKATQKPRNPDILWQVAEKKTLAVVAQPWILEDLSLDWQRLLETHVSSADYHFVWQHQLNPYHLRQEGWHQDAKLLASDAEVLGAARLCIRKNTVDGLVFISDETQPSDGWLEHRLQQLSPKGLRSFSLQQLSQHSGVDLLRYILEQNAPIQHTPVQDDIISKTSSETPPTMPSPTGDDA